MAEIEDLYGETLISVVGAEVDSEAIVFATDSGKHFKMWHDQDCCEYVRVAEVHGDVLDLVGTPILSAYSQSSHSEVPERSESETWTFYRLSTVKGTVTIRWLGESNGYYSESVNFDRFDPAPKPGLSGTVIRL